MPTKSISKSISVSGKKNVRALVRALEKAKKSEKPSVDVSYSVASKEEIREMFGASKAGCRTGTNTNEQGTGTSSEWIEESDYVSSKRPRQ